MTSPSTEVVPAGTYNTGLDDLGDTLSVPRLKIGHKTGTYVNPATGQEFGEIFCIILGLVRQRVLFDPRVTPGEVEKPMCKSPDALTGFPVLDIGAKRKFPWEAAKLDVSHLVLDPEGRSTLACGSCNLKEWDSHPLGGKPWCSEQYTMPILFAATKEQLLDPEGGASPALISIQKSGIKPTKTYLQTFKLQKRGAYTVITRMGLDVKKQGDTVYSTPTYKSMGESPSERWIDFSDDYVQIQEYLTHARPPAPNVEDGNGVKASEVLNGTATVSTAPTTISRPAMVATPATPPVDDDDDLPF